MVLNIPGSKVHGANMGPTWGRQDPGGPHVGHVDLAICNAIHFIKICTVGSSEVFNTGYDILAISLHDELIFQNN